MFLGTVNTRLICFSRVYDINSNDVLGSKNLVEFAVEKGLYHPEKEGEFNFSKAYTRDDERDRTYNDPVAP